MSEKLAEDIYYVNDHTLKLLNRKDKELKDLQAENKRTKELYKEKIKQYEILNKIYKIDKNISNQKTKKLIDLQAENKLLKEKKREYNKNFTIMMKEVMVEGFIEIKAENKLLKEYINHKSNCKEGLIKNTESIMYGGDNSHLEKYGCTCGLDKLLNKETK